MCQELGKNPRKHLFCQYKGNETDCPNSCDKCAIKIKENGDDYFDKKLIDEAITQYKRALFMEPQYAEAWLKLGESYSLQDKNEEAINAIDKALMIDHVYGEAMYKKALLYKKIEKYEEAFNAVNSILNVYSSEKVQILKRDIIMLANISTDVAQSIDGERSSQFITRQKLDEILEKLVLSCDQYEYSDSEWEGTVCLGSPMRNSSACLEFVCDRCKKKTTIRLRDEGGDEQHIIEKYSKKADEFVENGCMSTLYCYCDDCADELFPVRKYCNKRNFVFSISFPDSDKVINSFPQIKYFQSFSYDIALGVIKGAKTYTELSKITDTNLSVEHYQELLTDVLGMDNKDIFSNMLQHYTYSTDFISQFEDFFGKEVLFEASKIIDNKKDGELVRLTEANISKIDTIELAEMIVIICRYLKIGNTMRAQQIAKLMAGYNNDKKQKCFIISLLITLDPDIITAYLQELLRINLLKKKSKKSDKWIANHNKYFILTDDNMEPIRRRCLQIISGRSYKEIRQKRTIEIITYIKKTFPYVLK